MLYEKKQGWGSTASMLLRKVGNFGYDKQLFLLKLDGVDLSQTTPFYQSVLRAWNKVLKPERDCSQQYGTIREEPLFYNPVIQCNILNAASVRRVLVRAGLTKVEHLRSGGKWKTASQLSGETGIMSMRFLERLQGEMVGARPGRFREALEAESSARETSAQEGFPQLVVSPAVEEEEEGESGALQSFRNPELADFSEASGKALYVVSMKVLNKQSLTGESESRWTGLFSPGTSPRGSWRSLYKTPIEKRCADLQGRIIHGAVAKNRYFTHLDPRVGGTAFSVRRKKI